MRACDIIHTFHIFYKNFGHVAYGVKEIPWPNTLPGSVPGLDPEIYVSFQVAKFL